MIHVKTSDILSKFCDVISHIYLPAAIIQVPDY